MKILSEWEMSQWAYLQCRHGNDIPEIRNLITSSYWAYSYCRWTEDIKEMWSKIKYYYWAKAYCEDIKDRPEVRKYQNEIIK